VAWRANKIAPMNGRSPWSYSALPTAVDSTRSSVSGRCWRFSGPRWQDTRRTSLGLGSCEPRGSGSRCRER